MSNAAKKITTTGAATTGDTILQAVMIRTAATISSKAQLVLTDGNGGDTRLDIDIAVGDADTTIPVYLDRIRFKNGIHVSTLDDIASVTFAVT